MQAKDLACSAFDDRSQNNILSDGFRSSAEQICVFPGLQAGAALANLLRGPPAVHDFISSCVVAAAVHSEDIQVAAQAVVAVSALKAAQITSKVHREMLWHSVAMMVSSATVPAFNLGNK
jgi:hypothetical protein